MALGVLFFFALGVEALAAAACYCPMFSVRATMHSFLRVALKAAPTARQNKHHAQCTMSRRSGGIPHSGVHGGSQSRIADASELTNAAPRKNSMPSVLSTHDAYIRHTVKIIHALPAKKITPARTNDQRPAQNCALSCRWKSCQASSGPTASQE